MNTPSVESLENLVKEPEKPKVNPYPEINPIPIHVVPFAPQMPPQQLPNPYPELEGQIQIGVPYQVRIEANQQPIIVKINH